LQTEELRPDLVYSVFRTTIGSPDTITTLPTRISCAVFIAEFKKGKTLEKLRGGLPGSAARGVFVWPLAKNKACHSNRFPG
jgi:hypothetical protein